MDTGYWNFNQAYNEHLQVKSKAVSTIWKFLDSSQSRRMKEFSTITIVLHTKQSSDDTVWAAKI
jgi:hypothetical protein